MARVVKDIKIGESPDWMKKRLRACGIRPINNLVDITNYVMLEFGQPMHAFDLSTIAGKKIVVKRAQDGDVFTTLDGEELMKNAIDFAGSPERLKDADILKICASRSMGRETISMQISDTITE